MDPDMLREVFALVFGDEVGRRVQRACESAGLPTDASEAVAAIAATQAAAVALVMASADDPLAALAEVEELERAWEA